MSNPFLKVRRAIPDQPTQTQESGSSTGDAVTLTVVRGGRSGEKFDRRQAYS
jgi:hypothetical protein